MKELLVAGLGNPCISDDAIGVHVVKALRFGRPDGCLLAEIGTALFSVLHLFESAQRILIIDAAHGQQPAGTIYPAREIKAGDAPPWKTLREAELQQALKFLPARLRPQLLVMGIEPENLEYGMRLSPLMLRSVPTIVQAVRKTVADLLKLEPVHVQKPVVVREFASIAVQPQAARA